MALGHPHSANLLLPLLREPTRKEACDQIARLTTANQKLAKERDELADDNVNLQIETMGWQDEWYKMKMALKNSRKQMIYPKRSQRIKDRLKQKGKK